MYITIDKHNFQIRLNERNTPIYVEKKSVDSYILSVPMDLRDDELNQYLKRHAKKLIKEFELKETNNKSQTLTLYDDEFVCIYKQDIQNTTRSKKTIYTNIKNYKSINKIKLYKEILNNDITYQVGIWEERLDCIIENIVLKNFKNKVFKCHLKENLIEFSTQLKDKKLNYIEFIIAKAVFSHLELADDQQVKLLDKYIYDWKRHNKVFEYESE